MLWILRRVGISLALVWVVASIVFMALHLVPGDPAVFVLGTGARPDTLAALRQQLGLDLPWPTRYARWLGGVLTGEHGVGIEKRDLMPEMFGEDDLRHQQRVKCAFDDKHLLNPGKVFPVLHRCAELGRMHVHRGQVPFPDLPRF